MSFPVTILYEKIHMRCFGLWPVPAPSTSSGRVSTTPGDFHDREETPEALWSPIPSYDTDDCNQNQNTFFFSYIKLINSLLCDVW